LITAALIVSALGAVIRAAVLLLASLLSD